MGRRCTTIVGMLRSGALANTDVVLIFFTCQITRESTHLCRTTRLVGMSTAGSYHVTHTMRKGTAEQHCVTHSGERGTAEIHRMNDVVENEYC